ncbi:MAG: carbohydrate ABC transporter permease [Eubacteriales bacterium]|nr:carbohydrate ABC transporter permease [Eubacteriales bacterium]
MNARIKRKLNSDTFYITIVYILLIFAVTLCLYPLIYVVSASVSDPKELMLGNVLLLPKGLTLRAYQSILNYENILIGYRNTVFYTCVATPYNLLLTIFAAYPLSRKNLSGRNLVTFLITFTMFFSGGMIPKYLNMVNLHLINNPLVMIIPSAVNASYFIIMRNYFTHSVSEELIESACVEGASQWQTLFQVVLPVSRPVLGVITLYYLSDHWSSYFSAMMYLKDNDLMPLQIFLRRILILQSMDGMSEGNVMEDQLLYEVLKYAVIVASTLPMTIAYLFVRKSFKKGIMIGSLKG